MKFNNFFLSEVQMKMARLVLSIGYAAVLFITAWIFKPETALGRLAVWLTWTPAYIALMYWVQEAIRLFWKHALEEEYRQKSEGSE